MFKGMLLCQYLKKIGKGHLYGKVRYAIDHNRDNTPEDELVELVLTGRRMRNKYTPRRPRIYGKCHSPEGHRFDVKYIHGDRSMWSVLKGNDYFACRRYLLQHPDCDRDAVIERFARLGRLRVKMLDNSRTDRFARMDIDGRNVRELLSEEEFKKFAMFMKRHPGADWRGVCTMIKHGAKQLCSSRMWRGVTMLCALNGSYKDTMLVKQYARYHKCDDDTAMENVARHRGWKFGPDNIRIISSKKEKQHGKQV
jgi:hypothetical protein